MLECETIALTVGLGEDAIDLDDGLADLGSGAGSTVGKALAPLQRGTVVRSALPATSGGGSGNERL